MRHNITKMQMPSVYASNQLVGLLDVSTTRSTTWPWHGGQHGGIDHAIIVPPAPSQPSAIFSPKSANYGPDGPSAGVKGLILSPACKATRPLVVDFSNPAWPAGRELWTRAPHRDRVDSAQKGARKTKQKNGFRAARKTATVSGDS